VSSSPSAADYDRIGPIGQIRAHRALINAYDGVLRYGLEQAVLREAKRSTNISTDGVGILDTTSGTEELMHYEQPPTLDARAG
jgi:hypothetical protein